MVVAGSARPRLRRPRAAESRRRRAIFAGRPILVLFAYGGWNEMAYVAAEVRNPDKNILRPAPGHDGRDAHLPGW